MDWEIAGDREWLAGQLAEAGRRRGFVVVLRGLPGRGRPRLLDGLATGVAGWRVLRLEPNDAWPGRPGTGLAHLLVRLRNVVPETQAAQARLSEELLTVDHGRTPDAVRVLSRHLHELLQQCALHAPLLVVVDDTHLLDDRSAELLIGALRRRPVPGLAVLCSVALGEDPRFEASGLPAREVGLVTPQTAVRLIEERTGTTPHADVVGPLIDHVEAAPDRFAQLVDLLSSDDLAGWRELPVPLPPVVDATAAALLDRLPGETCEALALVALARVTDPAVIGAALERVGRRLADLEPAERVGAVQLDGADVAVTRPMVGSLSVTRLARPRQRAFHAALASAIAAHAPGESVAEVRHLLASSRDVDVRLVARLREVAHGSVAGGDLRGAAHLLTEAAARSRPGDERGALLLDAARQAWHGGWTTWAERLLVEAGREVASPLLVAELHTAKARVAFTRGTVDAEGVPLVRHAERIAAQQPDVAAGLYVTATKAAVVAGRLLHARRAAARALELATRGGRAAVVAATWLGGLEVVTGDRARGLQRLQDEGIDAVVAAGRPAILDARREELESLVWARGWSLLIRMLTGDLDAVRVELRELIGQVEADGHRGLVTLPLGILSLAEYRRGWWDAAEAHARRALTLAIEVGQPAMGANGHVTLATMAAARGDAPGCREHVAAIRQVGATDGAELFLGYAAAAEGLLQLGLGDARQAVERLEEAHRLARNQGIVDPEVLGADGDLVQAYVDSGRTADADALLTTLEALAGDHGWLPAVVARGRAVLATDHAEALDLLDTSDRLLKTMPMPFERARNRLLAAELHRRSGDHGRAVGGGGLARATLSDLHVPPWHRRAERVYHTASAAEGGRAVLATLSDQERRIAALVAEGGSNRTVANALALSPKTVEYHLRNVYAKLGVSNRSQLVRLVLEASSDPI
jgi:DNA-binding CsgD family transcriptional regulator